MQVLLIILAIIGGLVCLLLVIALFAKKAYTIQRSVNIGKPVEEVFDYIRFLKNQDNYNKWVMMDPQMKKMFAGTDGTVGFIYGWDGNNKAGAGEQEIKIVEPGSRVDVEVRFKRPFKGIANSLLKTSPGNGQSGSTNVQWTFASKLSYPANIFLLFMNVEKTLGKDLELSLANLKDILES